MSKINFAKVINDTIALENVSCARKTRISNVVGTVELLMPGQTLCLYSMALQLPGMIKFVPNRFAAAIMRIKDAISTTTCLVFRPGKIVVIGALTKHHSLFACHQYRKMIESVQGVFQNEDNRLELHTLTNRTFFSNWNVWNIVAYDSLPNRPNLYEIAKVASDVAVWSPESFPGLILLVWLRPKSECQCPVKKKNKSCECNSRALIFDSGRIVITGCKTMEAVNQTQQLIFDFLCEEEFQDHSGVLIPRHLRYEARRRKCLGIIEFAGWKKTLSSSEEKEDQEEVNFWDSILSGVSFRFFNHRKTPHMHRYDDEPFLKACKLEQVENVKTMASWDEDYVKKAYEYKELKAFLNEHLPKRNS